MPLVESSIKHRYNLRSGPLGNLDHPSNTSASSNTPKRLTKKQRRREQRNIVAKESVKKKLKRQPTPFVEQPLTQRKSKTSKKVNLLTGMGSFIKHATGPGVTISFAIEHKIKVALQCLLEEAMFKFCQDWAPEVLSKNNWLSPEMTELSLFARDLQHVANAKNGINKSLPLEWGHFIRTLERLHKLRHAAVHRVVVGEHGLDYIAADAVILLEAVQDRQRHAKMSIIRARVTDRDWDRTLEALEIPLTSVPILPFYGKKILAIDLTDEDNGANPVRGKEDREYANQATVKIGNHLEIQKKVTPQTFDETSSAAKKNIKENTMVNMIKTPGKGKRKREVIDLTKGDDDGIATEQARQIDRSINTDNVNKDGGVSGEYLVKAGLHPPRKQVKR